ncbi:glutamine-hydrolyzing carbamoyl-phosphate synthase small subunit [Desulfurivibrio alkaliphilus]|uniref:Carbamoyl phosphate synthase small chain n=1 Tax=Desulfurivibrio alkaliphilus (strain DSM 19089 / UNIQEM U267 / AHT2) TaxID=589865 RepID=D6Z229_DESAT|nr:glutamine-hydrolyzing carbamoyl-phosphate synthase small subunit [Desulfurivibrio alkaliphilus]ADH85604.1 carbamoyl-phosphate synthase, small subunit [Desulfurivibrio alkaliphilus AHT 2]
MKACIALEDGTVFEGVSFTGPGETTGEIVFNTGMSGYQELLSDPSYKGQIVTMTYPLIGNYGFNEEDMESERVQVEAFIVREYCPFPSNFRSQGSLAELLQKYGVLGVEGVDTRALTRHIRQAGAMKGVVSTEDLDHASLVAKAKAAPGLVGRDLAREVTCREPYVWTSKGPVAGTGFAGADPGRYKVVAIDYGLKYNQLRLLAAHGCQVQVVPCQTDADTILAMEPDGIFLSNGPGDPAGIAGVTDTIRELLGKKPIFGICLGNQLLSLAYGGRTYKLKFGHRGINQPVKDLLTGKVEITSQNHGFCVDMASLDENEVELTHINLNDNSVEGIRHRKMPAFSVQYHPENAPGPRDAVYLFERFVQMMS